MKNNKNLLEQKIQEVLNKLAQNNITPTPTLRKLSFKSKMGFGKYADLTVQEIINMQRTSYLRAIYYNLEGISFLDEVLEKLRIIGPDHDYTIPKPGKNIEYGEEIYHKLMSDLSFKVKSSIAKRHTKDNLQKIISVQKADKNSFSKDNLTRVNHGHQKLSENNTKKTIKISKTQLEKLITEEISKQIPK